MVLPEKIADEAQLEELLTRPSQALIESVKDFTGTVAILGIGGKMGTTLGIRLKRALDAAGAGARVVGVSRFSNPESRKGLEESGIETVAADLLNEDHESLLPDADRIVYMAGLKFGTTGNEAATWAMNALPPLMVCRRYPGKPVVAYSSGAVYDMVPLNSGGAVESMPLEPRGEYPNTVVARERVFEWAAAKYGNPVCQIRLFYANDLRYGVLRDIADSVYGDKEINLTMGAASLIWQGDAVDQSLRAFSCTSTPPTAINITGPETVSLGAVAKRFGELMGKKPRLTGEPLPMALIGNASRALGMFGYPEVPLDLMIRWTAAWVQGGGKSLGKPTHWEVTDGRY